MSDLTDAKLAEIEALAKAQPDLVVRGAGEEEYYAYFVELGLADTFDPTPPLLVSACPSPDTTEQTEQEKAHNTAAFHIAAKATILRLLAELRRLREALIPFARMHTDDIDGKPLSDRIPCDAVYNLIYCESEERPTVGDVHRARAALGDGWSPRP